MIKTMIIGAVSAIVSGLFLHLIIPGILGVAAAVLISGATLLDPLYAAGRVKGTWSTLSSVLFIQTLHTFISATITGVAIGFFSFRVQSGWLYIVGIILSLAIHYFLFFVFIAGQSVFSGGRDFGSVRVISLIIITMVAPIIGLISAFAVRKWG